MTSTHPSTSQAQAVAALKPQGAKNASAQSGAVQGLIDFIAQVLGAHDAQAPQSSPSLPSQNAQSQQTPQQEQVAATLNAVGHNADTDAPMDTAGLNPAILTALEQKFSSLAEDGQPLTQDALAQFKTDALKMLKDLGIDADDAQKYMAALTQALGSHITNAQAAWLMLPVQAPLQTSAKASDETTPKGTARLAQDVTRLAQDVTRLAQDVTRPAQDVARPAQDVARPAQNTTQSAPNTAKAAPDVANASLQKANDAPPQPPSSPQQDAAKPQVSGLAPDTSNKGLPAQQAAPQQAQNQTPQAPAPKASTPHAQGAQAASAAGSNGNGGSNNGTGSDGGSLNSSMGNMFASGQDGIKTALSTGQSFSTALTQAQTAPHIPQMVAVQIQRNAAANVNTFTMRLDPEELGSLEIRMSFGKDGSVKTHLIADKPETLTLLKHDAPHINRLLQQSGLNADEGSLSFDLRQQNQQHGQDDGYEASGTGSRRARNTSPAAPENALHAKIAIEAAGTVSQSGVNIMV